MKPRILFAAGSAVLLFGACTTMPAGPSVMALPGTGKNFEQFRIDDADCRNYAQFQIGGFDANQAATNDGLKSAAVGTAVGAIAGAAMGGHEGAGAGAGAGLIMGSVAGAGAAQGSAYETQRRYDFAYVQCMYAKGERVPVSSGFSGSGGNTQAPSQPERTAPPPVYYPPPPPPQRYSSARI
jgi:hypothetical protein